MLVACASLVACAALVVACSAHDPRRGAPATAPATAQGSAAVGSGGAAVGSGGAAVGSGAGLRLPDGVTPLAYDLTLEINPQQTSFAGEVAIRVRLDAATDHVWIHQDDLTITSARWDGGTLVAGPLGDEMRSYSFGRTLPAGETTLRFAYTGIMAHPEEGLFQQRDRDNRYVISQGESVFARHITPCFDEPRWKTPWRVTLIVPDGQVALSNMPEVKRTARSGSKVAVAFAETPPMPSYLLAIAVGPFELVPAGTAGKTKVPVRVAALAGDRDKVGVVAQRLPAITAALESYLDDPLPWPKLDLVAVPHLFGAMENPGLITFDAATLVGDPKDGSFASHFVRVAAHELAHQWFGNSVTPAWWDDLWLSEAFASWLGDAVWAPLVPREDPELALALSREQALDADDEPAAKTLHRAVLHNDDPDSSFDTIAYEKGQAVVGTFERFLGARVLRDTLRRYVRLHRGGTAVAADLIGVLGDASTPETAEAFAGYVMQPGVPIVELALHCTGKTATIAARARDHRRVPVCVRADGKRTCALVGDATTIALAACPKQLWGNDGAGYYRLAQPLASPPVAQLRPGERIALGDDIAAAFDRGELPLADALRALAPLASSSDPYTQRAAIPIARAIDRLVGDADRAAWSRWLAARFAPALANVARPAHAADEQVRDDLLALVPADLLPARVQKAERRLVDALLRRGDIPSAAEVAIAAPLGGRALFDQLVAAARAATDPDKRATALEDLGMFGPDLVAPTVALLADRDLPAEATWRAVSAYLDRGDTRVVAWHAIRGFLENLQDRVPSAEVSQVLDATADFCDPALRAEVAETIGLYGVSFMDKGHRGAAALAMIDRCIARRPHAAGLAAALQP